MTGVWSGGVWRVSDHFSDVSGWPGLLLSGGHQVVHVDPREGLGWVSLVNSMDELHALWTEEKEREEQ